MTVYLLYKIELKEYDTLVGIFSTKAKAISHCQQQHKGNFVISEAELDSEVE